jgi:hypothetical protein
MGVIGGGYFFAGPANLRFDSVFRDFIQGQQYVGVPYPVSGGPPGNNYREIRGLP